MTTDSVMLTICTKNSPDSEFDIPPVKIFKHEKSRIGEELNLTKAKDRPNIPKNHLLPFCGEIEAKNLKLTVLFIQFVKESVQLFGMN